MNSPARTVAILGSSGSIGRQTLEVALRNPDRLRVVALASGSALELLAGQCALWRPEWVALERAADPAGARARLSAAAPGAHVRVGEGSTAQLSADCGSDIVVNGVVGAAGLAASLEALARGSRLALANKETLVVGGPLVRAALLRGGELIPVDSEHSAVLQCLGGRPGSEVERLTLTASGGALRRHPDWRRASVNEVLDHPVWKMGRRITVDSATLFNKGLELIEANVLFGVPYERLGAVLHPQALIHALVTFSDGATVAQAAHPDMRLPIQLALSWPEHWEQAVAPLDPAALAGLEFSPIERGTHPAMDVALDAGRAGGTAPCVLNAADEVAVEAFLAGQIPLGDVPVLVRRALDRHAVQAVESLEQLVAVDRETRASVLSELARA